VTHRRFAWPSYLVGFVLSMLKPFKPADVPSVLPGDPPAISPDEAVMELPELSEDVERFEGPQPRQHKLYAESGGFTITGAAVELGAVTAA
jgi:hypothetical protein